MLSQQAVRRQVFERHRGTLDESLRQLGELLEDESRRPEGVKRARQLRASLGSLGLERASELARSLELAPDRAVELVPLIRNEVRYHQSGGSEPGASLTLLVVDEDAELHEALQAEARGRGVTVLSALNVTQARSLLGRGPQVAVLDLMTGGGLGLELLETMAESRPDLPVVVVTSSNALVDRVEVARLGGRGFLLKPLAASAILEEALRQFESLERQRFCVLAVDDDPAALDFVRMALTADALRLITLSDPADFWRTLEEVTPDLLLLDLDMPRFSGLDLLLALRGDTRYSAMPVLVLTGNTEPGLVEAVFRAGADDFVRKPLLAPELQARVRSRLDRFQLLRSLGETDPLTRLANRRRASQVIEQFLLLAVRRQHPFSLAVLDVDHFKAINDTRGHAVGDQVLRQLAECLRQSFRGEDVVGRWGGEEFVVGMYGMSLEDGVTRLQRVLESVRGQKFFDDEGSVTFSAGVAQFPTHGADLADLYRAADAALYRAKAAGRRQVLPAVSE